MIVAMIGHRKIDGAERIKEILVQVLEELILNENADTFLFGSKSEFNDLCYEVVSKLKDKFPFIQRIYVRAEYEFINERYVRYLAAHYEQSFYPSAVHGAGMRSYVKRNEVMIDMCGILIVYFNEGDSKRKKSGTMAAVTYARRRKKRFVNIYNR